MAHPEGYSGHQESAEHEEVRRDVTSLIDSFYTSPQLLKDKILRQNQQHILVRDALEEVEFFYDDVILPEEGMANILRLAHKVPSEKNVSPSIVVARLLRDISQIEGFKTEAYGMDVLHGTNALAKKEGESLEKHAKRVAQAEEIAIPRLHLSSSLGKQMALDVLMPVTFPHAQVVANQDTYESLFRQYREAVPTIFGSNDEGLWQPKILRSIEIGTKAMRLQ